MTFVFILIAVIALILTYILRKNDFANQRSDPASYIIQCRTNWFLNIRPADAASKNTKEYKALIDIAKKYFDKGDYERFSEYFMEGHYLIPLWTAHLIIEYGSPDESLKKESLNVIERYTDNPLAPEVAIQEKKWLDDYRVNSTNGS